MGIYKVNNVQLDFPKDKFENISREDAQEVLTKIIGIFNPRSWSLPEIAREKMYAAYSEAYDFGDLNFE